MKAAAGKYLLGGPESTMLQGIRERNVTIPITAKIYRDGKWFVAFCPEFPEANGQGETQEECIESLKAAIELLMEDRREDSRRNLPAGGELVEIA